ncbi:hypothetical protein RHMOL_Rhmol02G0071200 [Rhododendron molle]|uniref:Uncharacterized protein n=1 Tax=Rhododendron molle TaxID=49168 RepID=A0ACC0PP08_RHOML|nr:hypothetical protein RHMOL_Rhmol02G0071200 [Rhododendron molle]
MISVPNLIRLRNYRLEVESRMELESDCTRNWYDTRREQISQPRSQNYFTAATIFSTVTFDKLGSISSYFPKWSNPIETLQISTGQDLTNAGEEEEGDELELVGQSSDLVDGGAGEVRLCGCAGEVRLGWAVEGGFSLNLRKETIRGGQ